MDKMKDKWLSENSTLALKPIYTKIQWKIKKTLFSEKSPYQKIDFYESYDHGIIFTLDDLVMLTERDEFIYHEILTHTLLYTHKNPENILIIGGGDYGIAREILKHKEIKTIELSEIDEIVLKKCKDFFPYVKSVLKDKRFNANIEDGFNFIKKTKVKYDVIIIDSTDPYGHAQKLFQSDFINLCKNALKTDGIIGMQCGSSFYNSDIVSQTFNTYRKTFPISYLFNAPCHSYPGGYWSFILGSKIYNPISNFQEKRYQNLNFNYYNKKIHKASFILPNYILKIIN